MNRRSIALAVLLALQSLPFGIHNSDASGFEGRCFRGEGDLDYLQLLDIAGRMFQPDPEFQNVPMLYMPAWNGLVEGPTWDAWWIQNSYGPSYCALPFLQEPLLTFLQNSQDLWFDQMGDGKRVGAAPPFNWVAPDGCLCDAARPGWIVYRQGDGRAQMHDWGVEFTAAGLLLQSELLLRTRQPAALARYLPKLERCARFLESRRDPTNNLFRAGPAGNLLAPSFAGWKKPDGSYGQAFHAGLSVTYIAALERLIELEKLAGRSEQVTLYSKARDTARAALPMLTTPEGYFINSLDPDGTRHGVYGAARHGYFESSVNHDAIAFGIVDAPQAERIYEKIASIPGLRPHDFVIPNYPSYDDMYEKPQGLWAFGTWVNGGHWSTCEARMMLAYFRLEKFDDARRSMRQLLKFASRFRMDNPLIKFGSDVYQPGQPINLTYDAFGPPAGFIRGLFEYLYRAEGLMLKPHIPPGITRLEQRFPVWLGRKQIYLATAGAGPIRTVRVNGKAWNRFDAQSVFLPDNALPPVSTVEIALGADLLPKIEPPPKRTGIPLLPPLDSAWAGLKKANLATNSLPLRIAADSNGENRFRGDIARVRLFRRALTSNEIAALARNTPGQSLTDRSLVAEWRLEKPEQGAFQSTGGNELPARLVGTVPTAATPTGNVGRFDGSGYLQVPNSPALNLAEACTIEALVCPGKQTPGGARIADKSQVGTSNGYLLDTFPGDSLRLITQAGTLNYPALLRPGQWVHLAGSVDADGTLALYLDGKLVAEKKASPLLDLRRVFASAERQRRFLELLAEAGLDETPEAAHARLTIECLSVTHRRLILLQQGKLQPLPDSVSQSAADQSYLDTAAKLADGLDRLLLSHQRSAQPQQAQLARLWQRAGEEQKKPAQTSLLR